MTREEAIKKRDEQIADIREWVRNSDDAWEYGAVLSVIDEIVEEIKICDKHIEALQERPKGRWSKNIQSIGARYITYYKCSACEKSVFFGELDFCPNCGADMRESEE